jgi:hypothetical protein
MKTLLLIALVAGGVGWFGMQHERTRRAEARYAAVASELSGRPVHVHCQGDVGAAFDVSSEAGTVEFDAQGRPADVTNLKRFVCDGLARASGDFTKPEFQCVYGSFECSKRLADDVQALHTLAHESQHLAGQESESAAECKALQSTAYVATRFGADPQFANAIAHWAALHIYPHLPEAYHGPCYLP